MVVIDGKLFESSYDHKDAGMQLRNVGRSRVYWRGISHSGPWIVPVDIVTIEEFQLFANAVASESKILLEKMVLTARDLKKAYDEYGLSSLKVNNASRGFIGHPFLLRTMIDRERAAGNAESDKQGKT